MHSRDKGKSGSKRPESKIPSWSPYKDKEVEKLVIKFAKAGETSSEIGMTLRDSYGISCVKTLTGKTISAILKENKLSKELSDDLLNLIKKMVAVKQHLDKNKQDKTAKRGLQLTNSKILRLVKYYKKTNKLPQDWKFNVDRLKMYLD